MPGALPPTAQMLPSVAPVASTNKPSGLQRRAGPKPCSRAGRARGRLPRGPASPGRRGRTCPGALRRGRAPHGPRHPSCDQEIKPQKQSRGQGRLFGRASRARRRAGHGPLGEAAGPAGRRGRQREVGGPRGGRRGLQAPPPRRAANTRTSAGRSLVTCLRRAPLPHCPVTRATRARARDVIRARRRPGPHLPRRAGPQGAICAGSE